MPLKNLRFTNAGPFSEAAFDFDDQVNVFVGPNNCGKSTTLMVLAEILVYLFKFPRKLLRSESSTWEMLFEFDGRTEEFSGSLPSSLTTTEVQHRAQMLKKIGYTVFVPALRESTDFRSKGPLVRAREKEIAIRGPSRTLFELSARILEAKEPEFVKRSHLISTSASLVKDEAIVQKVIELDYEAYLRKNPSIQKLLPNIACIASEITEGFPLKFLGVDKDENGFFPKFRTPDGEVPLDCLSQGTQSMIQWLAHFLIGYAEYYEFPKELRKKPGILIIDDVDAHLHPSWQQRIIPTVLGHFPNLQIFFATHSPLMLAGLRAGQVHLLRRKGDGKVSVTRNETDIVGWSADEILRGVMDMSSPTDLGTARKVERLKELRRRERLSKKEAKELDQLRHEVGSHLLGGPFAAQLEELRALLKEQKDSGALKPQDKGASKLARRPKAKGRARSAGTSKKAHG